MMFSRQQITKALKQKRVEEDPFLPKSPADILGLSRPKPEKICGIYFLMKGPEIVYIGQSTDVEGRVATHAHSIYGHDFDRFAVVPVDALDLDRFEAEYIARFQPSRNRDNLSKMLRSECR